MDKYHVYILVLFCVGAIAFVFINKKKTAPERKENWIKFFSYFATVNLVIITLLLEGYYFLILSCIIVVLALGELFTNTKREKALIRVLSIVVFLILGYHFIHLSFLEKNTLIFTYYVVLMFDGFSQIFGQLFGRIKITPRISPNKTLLGLLGGISATAACAYFFKDLISDLGIHYLSLSLLICIFAFIGDLSASWLKRRLKIKDFSNLLPGQGGVLDRFDSLIFVSIFAYYFL